MAPHSSTLAWKIPWMEEPGRLQSMGSLESDTTEQLHFHFSLSCIGEGNGNLLQCSCLEIPRDGGAWWAAVYGVAQNRTQLKRLSSSSSIEQKPEPHSHRVPGELVRSRMKETKDPSPQYSHPKLGTKCVEPLSSRNQMGLNQKSRTFPHKS